MTTFSPGDILGSSSLANSEVSLWGAEIEGQSKQQGRGRRKKKRGEKYFWRKGDILLFKTHNWQTHCTGELMQLWDIFKATNRNNYDTYSLFRGKDLNTIITICLKFMVDCARRTVEPIRSELGTNTAPGSAMRTATLTRGHCVVPIGATGTALLRSRLNLAQTVLSGPLPGQ